MYRCDKCKSFKYTDICPDYKDKELFDIFIQSREEDIKNIKKAILEAKYKRQLLSKN